MGIWYIIKPTVYTETFLLKALHLCVTWVILLLKELTHA